MSGAGGSILLLLLLLDQLVGQYYILCSSVIWGTSLVVGALNDNNWQASKRSQTGKIEITGEMKKVSIVKIVRK